MEPFNVDTGLINSAVAKFGAVKCKKAFDLFQTLGSHSSVAQEPGCSATDAMDMVVAALNMKAAELNSSLAGFSHDRDRLPSCQVAGCAGKVGLVRGDGAFFCDTCFAQRQRVPKDSS